MSIALMSGVFAAGPNDPKQRLVLIALADSAGADGSTRLNAEALAAKCAMSLPEVGAVLADLRALGWITGGEVRPRISGIRMGIDQP